METNEPATEAHGKDEREQYRRRLEDKLKVVNFFGFFFVVCFGLNWLLFLLGDSSWLGGFRYLWRVIEEERETRIRIDVSIFLVENVYTQSIAVLFYFIFQFYFTILILFEKTCIFRKEKKKWWRILFIFMKWMKVDVDDIYEMDKVEW